MPISKEDANKLLENRNITDETYNSIPLVMNPNQMSTDAPMIDASAVAGKEQVFLGPLLTGAGQVIKGAAQDAAQDAATSTGKVIQQIPASATFENQQSMEAPVFENTRADEAQKTMIEQGEDAKEGLETIGKTQRDIAAPVSEKAFKGAERTITLGTESADYIKDQMKINDKILADSEKALGDLRSKITVNPNRYMQQLSADGKGPMVTLALVLGGIGSGLTGQPNAAMAFLENRIKDDIDAQQTSIKNAFEQEGNVRALSKEVRAAAGENVMAKSASQAIVLTGYKAAIENVLQYVTDKTALEKAQSLILKLDEGIAKATLDYDNIHKANIKSGSAETSNLLGAGILGYTNNLGLGSAIGVPRQIMDTTGVRNQYGLGITQPIRDTFQTETPKKEEPKKETSKKERSFGQAFLDGVTKQMFGAADK
jgi:hypothetical protein